MRTPQEIGGPSDAQHTPTRTGTFPNRCQLGLFVRRSVGARAAPPRSTLTQPRSSVDEVFGGYGVGPTLVGLTLRLDFRCHPLNLPKGP
jgi:hypothetical protein